MTAQAADTTLTLACQGTASLGKTELGKPEPTSMGIIVNFTTGAVNGFGLPAKVTSVDEVTILFDGSWGYASVNGSIDRVTGDAEATVIRMTKSGEVLLTTSYALKCKPSQRMF